MTKKQFEQEMQYQAMVTLTQRIYVRVVRDERHVNRCFTDLTVKEQQNFLNTLEKAGLKRMIMMLSEALRNVGDQLDLHLDD